MMRFARLPGVLLQKRALSGVDLTGSNLTAARLAASEPGSPATRSMNCMCLLASSEMPFRACIWGRRAACWLVH